MILSNDRLIGASHHFVRATRLSCTLPAAEALAGEDATAEDWQLPVPDQCCWRSRKPARAVSAWLEQGRIQHLRRACILAARSSTADEQEAARAETASLGVVGESQVGVGCWAVVRSGL